jgi:hypothetical protein
MQPESSDGFASVGTILPKEKAALLPGGLFAFAGCCVVCVKRQQTTKDDLSLRCDADTCWSGLVSPIAME